MTSFVLYAAVVLVLFLTPRGGLETEVWIGQGSV